MTKLGFVKMIGDLIKQLGNIFIITILVCVCIDRGWLPNWMIKQTTISHSEFWGLFQSFSAILLLYICPIDVLRGKYNILKESKKREILWSVKLAANGWLEDLFIGNYAECIQYCQIHNYELDGKEARLAAILDEDSYKMEMLEMYIIEKSDICGGMDG